MDAFADAESDGENEHHSIELEDGWITRESDDDNQSVRSSHDGRLRTTVEQQQLQQYSSHSSRQDVQSDPKYRPQSREIGYTSGECERTDDERLTGKIQTKERDNLYQISHLHLVSELIIFRCRPEISIPETTHKWVWFNAVNSYF